MSEPLAGADGRRCGSARLGGVHAISVAFATDDFRDALVPPVGFEPTLDAV
jgi:hypothetical protein